MTLHKILGLNTKELRDLLESEGWPSFRGTQLAEWVYGKNASNFSRMKNIPQELRFHLEAKYEIGRLKFRRIQRSKDGTFKLLLELKDGENIEAVGLPYRERFSCCLSTQVGCPVGCLFCATGKSGFKRNLDAGEITGQLIELRKTMEQDKVKAGGNPINNVVLMGMGEPLYNYDATLKALRIMNEELGIGARYLTLSTVGYVPGIKALMKEKLQITLAISLHAPTDELRGYLIPGMRQWKVREIINACREYFDFTGRRITFEYCLLGGVNDSTGHALQLAALLKNLNCHVNVIPFNPVTSIPFRRPQPASIDSFIETLNNERINVTRRFEKGIDIDAACGQLRLRDISSKGSKRDSGSRG
jgi:23S rRNA (adenine2503-C2)-methyltransferase